MTAAELQQAAKALAAMFSCFPQSALADVEMQMRGYLAAVQDAELADVQAAIQRFIRGEAKTDNAQFCPSSAPAVDRGARAPPDARADRQTQRDAAGEAGEGVSTSTTGRRDSAPLCPAGHLPHEGGDWQLSPAPPFPQR